LKTSRVIRHCIAGLSVVGVVSALPSCSSSSAVTPGSAGTGSLTASGGGSSGSSNAGGATAAGATAAGATAGVAGASSALSSSAGASGKGGGSSGQAGATGGGPAQAGSSGRGGSGGTGGKGGAGGVGSGGGAGTGTSASYGGGGGQPPTFTDGTQGWASRYWDCCKPACGWKGNVGGRTPVQSCSQSDQPLSNYDARNACESGGEAYMCHSVQPWAVSATLAYGFAAVNKGSDYCGKCYQLQFTGESHNGKAEPGSASLAGKTMIVQAINNGGVESNQFDLLVPGGGVGLLDACSKQWGTKDLGEQYGGFYLACQKSNGFDYAKSVACARAKCESVFASKPDLLTGCEWFIDWYGAADNPTLTYKEVTCPDQITKNSGLKR